MNVLMLYPIDGRVEGGIVGQHDLVSRMMMDLDGQITGDQR